MPRPRLVLLAPAPADLAAAIALAPRLAAAAAAGNAAAVVLRPTPGDERVAKDALRRLADPLQAAGAAVLLDGDPRLAARAGLDGVHARGVAALPDALASARPERQAGCGGMMGRDEPMQAGELGADYVLFGDAPEGLGLPDLLDRLSWWSELFEVPCIGLAPSPADVAALAATGADFVALGEALWDGSHDPTAACAAAREVLHAARTAGS